MARLGKSLIRALSACTATILLQGGCVAAAEVSAATGSWQGTYVCPQGVTNLTLDIDAATANRVTAVFTFAAAASNPGVPAGCFEMAGKFNAQTHHLMLEPGRWLLKPTGFITVGLSGDISPDGVSMSGQIISPGCGAFYLQRLSAAPFAFAQDCQPLRQVA